MRIWVAIWVGSSRISRKIAAWIAGGVVIRPLVLGAVALFLKGWPGWDLVVPLVAAAWLIAAIYLGLKAPNPLAEQTEQRQAEGKAADDDAEQAPAEAEQPAARKADRDVPIEDVATLLRALDKGGAGVHLNHLSKALPGPPWATGEARALMGRLGIRVRAGVRVPGVGPREGVHRDDWPPLPSPTDGTAPDGVVAAGQSNNNDNNNGSGYPFTIVDDADNPARSHVIPHPPRAH